MPDHRAEPPSIARRRQRVAADRPLPAVAVRVEQLDHENAWRLDHLRQRFELRVRRVSAGLAAIDILPQELW